MRPPKILHVALVFAVFGVIDLIKRRKEKFKNAISTIFSIGRIIGFVIIAMAVFNFGPESLRGNSTGAFALNKIVVPYLVSIRVAAAFLPFLLNYGLVDFIGVLTRPIMRPLFKLPGRAAVIGVSAFLGNFSLGHISINEEYQTGKMTNQECQIIGTGLSTVSIGFLILIANNTGIMSEWNKFFWCAFAITLLVTVIYIRLRPIRKVPQEYCPGGEPAPENEYNTNLLQNAFAEALCASENSGNYFKNLLNIQKNTVVILTAACAETVFFATVGLIIKEYTPIVKYLGYCFYPFVMPFVPLSEVGTVCSAAVLSFIDITLPSLTVATGTWSVRTLFLVSVIPVSSIVFLSSFIPTIMATKVPVKFGDLCLIFIERMILSIILCGIAGLILF